MIIRKVFLSESTRTKNSWFKNWSICGRKLHFKIRLFFKKFLFKIEFSMKRFTSKSCLLKKARKVKKLLFFAEQIESKRYSLDVMFLSKSDSSIKIELEIYFSEKKICLHRMIFRKVFYRNPPGQETLDSKADELVGKNFTSKFDFFSPERSISKCDFQWKGLLQNHAF